MAAAVGERPVGGGAPPPGVLYSFGTPWPELNQGLTYTDTFRCADADVATTLIEFYSTNYKSSAPLPGWIKRIRNGQITVDGEVVTDPDMILGDGSKWVYHRFPWHEPFAPYLLEVLYEDDDIDALSKSNEVFETYKQEMEKMISVIKNLKENEFMKGKCENSDIALVKLIEERELTKKQIEKLKNQKEKLESLCRSLQAEMKQGSSASVPDAPSSQEDVSATSQES